MRLLPRLRDVSVATILLALASPIVLTVSQVQPSHALCNGTATVIASGDPPVLSTQNIGSNSSCTVEAGGSISTTANNAVGINADDTNTINNHGAISTTGNDAYGINADNANTITNSGSISTAGSDAYGIVADTGNTITNSGPISTTGNNAYGIFVNAGNTITNIGLISATNASAIRFFGANNVLNLMPGSVIVGAIEFDSAINTLNILNNVSTHYTLADNVPNTLNANGNPVIVSGLVVSVLDGSAFGAFDEFLSETTNGIFNSVNARLASGNAVTGNNGLMSLGFNGQSLRMNLGGYGGDSPRDGAGQPANEGGLWIQGLGGYRSQDTRAADNGVDVRYGGVIAGADAKIMSGTLRLGAFGGYMVSDVDVDTNSRDLKAGTGFGGIYASVGTSGWFARLMFTAGVSNYDSDRRVLNNAVAGGIQTASANFDGRFVSPEAAIGTRWNFVGIDIVPSARLRYAHLTLDSYTETGSAQNLTVAGREVSLWQGRLQLAFPTYSAIGSFTPRIGVEARTSDNDSVSTTLNGTAIAFSPGGADDDVTGFAGATLETRIDGGIQAFADAEFHAGSEGTLRTEARFGLKVRF